VYKKLPEFIDSLKRQIIGFPPRRPALVGKTDVQRQTSDVGKPDAKAVEALLAEANKMDEKKIVDEASALLKQVGLTLEVDLVAGDMKVLWKWDGGAINKKITYTGDGKNIKSAGNDEAFLISTDSENKTFFVKNLSVKGHAFALIPAVVKVQASTQFNYEIKMFLQKNYSGNIMMGIYKIKSPSTARYYMFKNGPGKVFWLEKNMNFPDGKYETMYRKEGLELADVKTDVWITANIKKQAGTNEIILLIDKKEVNKRKIDYGNYNFLFGLIVPPGATAKDKVPRIYQIKIKGKSLGKSSTGNKLYADLMQAVMSDNKGIRIFQFYEDIIEILKGNLQIVGVKNIVLFNDREQMGQVRKKYKEIMDIYNFQFVFSEDLLSSLSKEKLERLVYYNISSKEDEFYRVVLADTDFQLEIKLDESNIAEQKFIPFKYDAKRFNEDIKYQRAYFAKTASMAKGDNSIWNLNISDSYLSINDEFIDAIVLRWDEIAELSKAA